MGLHEAFAKALEQALNEESKKAVEIEVEHFRQRLERVRTETIARLLEHTELTTREDPCSPTVEFRVTLHRGGTP